MSRPSAGRKPRGQICNPLRDRSAQNRGEAPSPSVASLLRPLPARRGEVKKKSRSRGAILRPSYAHHHDAIPKKFAPGNKREAKRRKAQSNHWPRSTNKRCRRSMPGRGCAPYRRRARLPALHRGTRQAERIQPVAQPQNRVSRHLELAGVLPAYILASVKRAPRRPVFLPVDRCPRAARERIAFIRARAPHSLRLPRMPSREAPLVSEMPLRNHNGDQCQPFSDERHTIVCRLSYAAIGSR